MNNKKGYELLIDGKCIEVYNSFEQAQIVLERIYDLQAETSTEDCFEAAIRGYQEEIGGE